MILRQLREKNGWMFADYEATYRYGWNFVLKAAQYIIDADFMDDLQRVATADIAGDKDKEWLEEVRSAGNKLVDCPNVSAEQGVLIVSGLSRIMGCPMQIMFYNQTDHVCLTTPKKEMFAEDNDVFTKYMDSIEINVYKTL